MSSSNADGDGSLPLVMASLSIDPDAASYSDLVTVRQTESAGMAVFARKDIPRGTRIAAETPLIMIPPGPDEESPARFCKALLQTAEEDLARIDRHHCDPLTLQSVATTAIGVEIQRWIEANLSALNTDSSSSSSSTSKSLEDIAEQTCRRYAIFLTNNLDTGGGGSSSEPEPEPGSGSGSGSEPESKPESKQHRGGRGLFHLFSRMNHSCTPNVFDHYNTSLGRLTSHTTRDVPAGAELCSHYIDVLMPRRVRRKKLRAWGFICSCLACTNNSLEAHRERAIELDDMLEEYADYYCRGGNGNGNGREVDDGVGGGERGGKEGEEVEVEDKPIIPTTARALELCRELIQLLTIQCLYGLELFNVYRLSSKFSLELGDAEKALEYARLARDVERCCVGRDATLADDLWEDTNKWIESLNDREKKLTSLCLGTGSCNNSIPT